MGVNFEQELYRIGFSRKEPPEYQISINLFRIRADLGLPTTNPMWRTGRNRTKLVLKALI